MLKHGITLRRILDHLESLARIMHTLDRELQVPDCTARALHDLGEEHGRQHDQCQGVISPTIPFDVSDMLEPDMEDKCHVVPGKGLSVGFLHRVLTAILGTQHSSGHDVKVIMYEPSGMQPEIKLRALTTSDRPIHALTFDRPVLGFGSL